MNEGLTSARMNRRMASLDPFAFDARTASGGLHADLDALVNEGFAMVSGCFVFSFTETARRTSVAACIDGTGFEAFVNHLHVDDYVDGVSPAGQLPQAMMP